MLPTIRTFCNTDVAALCKVWNAHFGDLGISCQIDELRFELSSLAKPYFRAEDLLIAEIDEQMVGFLHFGQLEKDAVGGATPKRALISALCILPCDSENTVAKALLTRAEQLLGERQVEICSYKPMLPDVPFYLGLGPADSMIGATSSERRGCTWVRAASYSPQIPTTQWELDLNDFQPPIDRIQIQIRRSSYVDRQVDEPKLPWWQACALGHTEPTYFQLTSRTDRGVLSEAMFWSVASELQTEPHSLVWLWPVQVPEDDLGPHRLTFLLGECCRQWQSERVELVRTVSAANDMAATSILRRLGFTDEQNGMVFQKKLS